MPKPATYWWIITRNGHPLDGTMRRTRKEAIDNFLHRHPDAQITTWPTDWREWQDWGYAVVRVTVEVQERKSHCEDDLEMVGSSPDPQSAPDIKMHIDNWGPGIAGKVVLAMDGGKVVASMALSDLLESCSPPDAGLEVRKPAKITARDAVAYLADKYQMEVSPMDESPKPHSYTHIGGDMRQYRVTVERVSGVAESESEKSDE